MLSTIARVAIRSSTPMLATVRSAFGVHTHDVLFQVGLRHKTFGTQLTMILFLFVILGNVKSKYPPILEHFHTELAHKCFITVDSAHVHL